MGHLILSKFFFINNLFIRPMMCSPERKPMVRTTKQFHTDFVKNRRLSPTYKAQLNPEEIEVVVKKVPKPWINFLEVLISELVTFNLI